MDRSSARETRGLAHPLSQPDNHSRWRRRSRARRVQTRAAATPPHRDRIRHARTDWPARRPRSDHLISAAGAYASNKPGHLIHDPLVFIAAEHVAKLGALIHG